MLGVPYGLARGRLILHEAHGSAMRDWNLHLCTGGALKRLGQKLLLGMLCMCLCVSLALAQSESGSVTGQVKDPQGAAVVGAEVTATNIETGIAIAVTSSDAGAFYFSSLHPSRYKISVKASGFKESVLDIEVHVQDRLSENVTLALGSSAETVDVSASSGE